MGPIFPTELFASLTRNISEYEIPVHAKHIVGFDWGMDHPAAGVWIAWDWKSGRVYVIDSFSAHGDYSEILRWLSGFKRAPRRTFLVHGEPNAIEAMKDHIVSSYKAWQVEIPTYRQTYDI